MNDKEKAMFNIDVSKIKWKMYIMNHAYGIKKYILKEEAVLPSAGYNDVIKVRNFWAKYNKVHVIKTWRELYSDIWKRKRH